MNTMMSGRLFGDAVAKGLRYPTVMEITDAVKQLASLHPRHCTVETIGLSRAGDPLVMLSIGAGDRSVLVVAGAHADEPIGRISVIELACRLLKDPDALAAGTVWHLVPCIDPDGARLCRDARADQSFEDYLAGYYRPSIESQPEWAPSIGHLLPESSAVVGVVGQTRPRLQCTLHNLDIGGTFAQLTRDVPGFADAFLASAAALEIPVDVAPYDTFYWNQAAAGVFVIPPANAKERFDADAEDPRLSTWNAPLEYGGMTSVVEVPQRTSPQFANTAEVGEPDRALLRVAEYLRERALMLQEAITSVTSPGDPLDELYRGSVFHLQVCIPVAEELERIAPTTTSLSMASYTSLLTSTYRWPLRSAAMMRRATSDEGLRTTLGRLITRWCGELAADVPTRWLPIEIQVEQQVRSVLFLARLTAEE
ncbi:MAG: 3-hydroxyacyl-CoA dehydrogenase [Catenulispora sp.]|nr:3-hydroxyacyl-CoA dehydrogenase [Catenulispora sp.]